jgi:hypothetical protein
MTSNGCWMAFLLWTVSGLAGQDYCSLTVRVVTPDGRRPQVSVSVQEANGRVVEKDHESRDVRFCDLGGLPVTVKVGGSDTCNQVIVREVPIAWNEPYLLKVTYDPEPCLVCLPPPPRPICRVVFRIADRAGGWVPGAAINISHPAATSKITDSFGRASYVTRRGEQVRGSISVDDKLATFEFTCAEPVHEEWVKLEKR